MARYVTLTYKVWVGDGDDEDCTSDAEAAVYAAIRDDDFSEIQRHVELRPSSPTSESPDRA